MLRVKIRAIYEDIAVPADRGPFIALAERAKTGGERERYVLYTREYGPAAPGPAALWAVSSEADAVQSTALYRWFDAANLLLYVGISDNLSDRAGNHFKRSSWMDFTARSTVERFPSREKALEAETSAIKAEHPIFNERHNKTPEARRRLVEYLVEHDRLDLLAPAVTRG